MAEITELDMEKYFVVKQEDLDDALDEIGTSGFEGLIFAIEKEAERFGNFI